ncbi:PHP domain protein [Parafrankia sp. EUN1f]|nr:PHP domain-containing protein [Parafrankia sp. EUN1f]EFC83811.1 PHP domain protein [Parafrankia sp. EUN1f]
MTERLVEKLAAKPQVPVVRYAELHCHSAFSFLDGASQPEDLVAEAVRLGLSALALTDHNGMYGTVRFAEAAAAAGLPTVFGTEVSFGSPAPATGRRIPTRPTSSSSPGTPRGTAGCPGRCPTRIWPAGRRES